MMCQFVNVLDVTALPVYRPSPEEVDRPELFAANVRAVYTEAGGMRAAEESQREFLALTKVDATSPMHCRIKQEFIRAWPDWRASPVHRVMWRRLFSAS